MSEWTQGPWLVEILDGHRQRPVRITDLDGNDIACIAWEAGNNPTYCAIKSAAEAEANARLIAQSPALLAAAEHLGLSGHRFGSVASEACPECIAAKMAIARARSKEPLA